MNLSDDDENKLMKLNKVPVTESESYISMMMLKNK